MVFQGHMKVVTYEVISVCMCVMYNLLAYFPLGIEGTEQIESVVFTVIFFNPIANAHGEQEQKIHYHKCVWGKPTLVK